MSEILMSLVYEWGDEYKSLTTDHRQLVNDDYLDADYECQRDYRHNIGRGNLASYANCLAVQRDRVGH